MMLRRGVAKVLMEMDGLDWGRGAVRAILSWIQAVLWDIQADMKWVRAINIIIQAILWKYRRFVIYSGDLAP